jgi:hypothetical protein
MLKKPITVYWGTFNENWSLLYLKPKSLFQEMNESKVDNTPNPNILMCPAFNGVYKNVLVFRSGQDCHYRYDFKGDKESVEIIDPLSYKIGPQVRKKAFEFGPSIELEHRTFLFADEPLVASFTPPYFHKPAYTNYGAAIPGKFDIGQWFRPYNFEIQTWQNSGDIIIKENEPLFYVEFLTDRPIILKRFNLNTRLEQYLSSCLTSNLIMGQRRSLLSRYERFKNTGLREKVLTEIKNNLVED